MNLTLVKNQSWRAMFSIDLRTLALIRICFALLILYDLITKIPWIKDFYTDYGVLPRAGGLAENNILAWRWSLHFISGEYWFQLLLFAIAGLFAIMLLFGYRTRLATIISWLFLISLQNRNMLIISGADDLLRLLMFWSIFLPLGARFSVDAALDDNADNFNNDYFSPATIALLCQAAALYFFTALLKWHPMWIPSGQAVYYALHIDHYATSPATWLRHYPNVTKVLTYYVWFLEFLMPFLVFLPCLQWRMRLWTMLALILMHLGFHTFLRIGMFPYVSITSILAFTPAVIWNYFDRKLSTPAHNDLTIYYDAGCGFCYKFCRIICIFLLLPRAIIKPANSNQQAQSLLEEEFSWVVKIPSGQMQIKWAAFCVLIQHSPLWSWLLPIFKLNLISQLGDRIYNRVAENRTRLSRLSERWWKSRAIPMHNPWWVSLLIITFAVTTIVFNNLNTLPKVNINVPTSLVQLTRELGLSQYWGMFAPYPFKNDGWYVIEGKLTDASKVDVYHNLEQSVSWAKPNLVADDYPYWRWRKYMHNLYAQGVEKNALLYARYLCRQWNHDANRAWDRKLQTFEIYYMLENTEFGNLPFDVEKTLFWKHQCY